MTGYMAVEGKGLARARCRHDRGSSARFGSLGIWQHQRDVLVLAPQHTLIHVLASCFLQ
jgi:hypothetical protein